MHFYDVLIIGSGAAGMTLASQLTKNYEIAILSKDEPNEGSTFYAQGGVAAVLDEYDSMESHIEDTLDAGAGLCHREIVEFTVRRSPQIINWLVKKGVNFDKKPGASGTNPFHLTKEGGHSHRRVLHAADATGREIALTLYDALNKYPNVSFFKQFVAVDLVKANDIGLKGNSCLGAYVLNLESGDVELFRANHVILATGGASKVYLYTSNPDTASGDGIAMAWRAGCRVANLAVSYTHLTLPTIYSV